MASPPRLTTSPQSPHTSVPGIAISKKRPALHFTSTSAVPNKRHKGAASITSGTSSAHPLRQTSFPPEKSGPDGDRSPSVSSDLTGLVPDTSLQGKTKRHRGKGRKSSTNGMNSAQSPKSGRDGPAEGRRRSESKAQDMEDEDDDEDELAQLQAAADVDDGPTLNDATAEKQKLSVLTAAFDQEQEERYSMFRRCKLKPEKVRKITNAVVSQSVPQAVVTAVNGIGKVFVGRLVERAREVRAEWGPFETSPGSSHDTVRENGDKHAIVTGLASSSHLEPHAKERDFGPLQADHLREALRRLQRQGEMGGSGLGGLSVGLGIAGAASVRRGERRLFR